MKKIIDKQLKKMFTTAELNQLIQYVDDVEENRHYWGNEKYFRKRHKRIKQQLKNHKEVK